MENVVLEGNAVDRSAEELRFDQIERIRQIRKRIDGLAFIVSSHEISPTPSMEKINAHANLLMAKSWLQDVLEYLGVDPINANEVHTVHDIADDTDVSDPLKVQVRKMEAGKQPVLIDANEIESLNHVRTDINNILNMVADIPPISENIYESLIYQNLKQARFWMERQLIFLKKEDKRKHFEHANPGIKSELRKPGYMNKNKKVPLIVNRPREESQKIPLLKPEDLQHESISEDDVRKEVEQIIKEGKILHLTPDAKSEPLDDVAEAEIADDTVQLGEISDEQLFGKDHIETPTAKDEANN